MGGRTTPSLSDCIAAVLMEHTIARGESRGWICRCGFEGDPTPDSIAAHTADMLAPLVAAEQARAVEDVAKAIRNQPILWRHNGDNCIRCEATRAAVGIAHAHAAALREGSET